VEAQQEETPLRVVEIDPVGGFVDRILIARIPRVGDSRQESVQSFSQVNRK
jgi:hypothetical protein